MKENIFSSRPHTLNYLKIKGIWKDFPHPVKMITLKVKEILNLYKNLAEISKPSFS